MNIRLKNWYIYSSSNNEKHLQANKTGSEMRTPNSLSGSEKFKVKGLCRLFYVYSAL